jgi:hypothetical protein
MKAELEGLRAALENARAHSVKGIGSPEVAIRETVKDVRAASKEIHDLAQTLERRREALRRFLPTQNGERPIRIEFDFATGTGWRRAMTRATVRHLSLRRAGLRLPGADAVVGGVVAGAVTAEGEHPDCPGWEFADGLPTRERELVTASFEEVGELVGAGTEGWA